MDRIVRNTFNAIAAFSLLLCTATAALWVRSHCAVDLVWILPRQANQQHSTRWVYSFASQPGRVSFARTIWRAQWSSERFTHVVYVPAIPAPGADFNLVRTANRFEVTVPDWLALSLALILPATWVLLRHVRRRRSAIRGFDVEGKKDIP
jgi:hypothetical protein